MVNDSNDTHPPPHAPTQPPFQRMIRGLGGGAGWWEAKTKPNRQRPATMTPDEVAETLQAFREGTEANGEDPFTRLGWRPAWSIRSRRGAWAPFVEMVRSLFQKR